MSQSANEHPEASSRPGKSSLPQQRDVCGRGRRWAVSVAVLVLIWLFWPEFCFWNAYRQLRLQAPTTAMQWVDQAGIAGHSRTKVAKLRCLAARRIGDPQLVRDAIEQFQQTGAAEREIEREKILFLAQSGELAQVDHLLSSLLTDPDHDNRDVSISYLIGYLRVQRYMEAGLLTEALMKDAPDDPFPWYVQGKVFALQQSLNRAEEGFRKAIQRSPRWREPRLELAHLLSDSHRQREAIPLYDALLQEDRQDRDAAVGLAECFKAVGDPAQGRAILEAALANGEQTPALLISLGRTEFEDGSWQKAAGLLRQALELQPWADDAVFLLAQCERQLGNEESADRLFAQVSEVREGIARLRTLQDQVAVQPDNEPLRLEAALLLLKYTDPEDGVVALQAIIDQNPRCREAHTALLQYFESVKPATEGSKRQAEMHRDALLQLEE